MKIGLCHSTNNFIERLFAWYVAIVFLFYVFYRFIPVIIFVKKNNRQQIILNKVANPLC